MDGSVAHPTSCIRSKERPWLACAVVSPITASLAPDVAGSHWQREPCLMGSTRLERWTVSRASSSMAEGQKSERDSWRRR